MGLGMNVAVLKLSNKKAKEILKLAADDNSRLRVTRHAQQRMAEREVSMRHVLAALRSGRFEEPPCWNPVKGTHELSVIYYYAGVRIKVVAAIEGLVSSVPCKDVVIVITVVKLA